MQRVLAPGFQAWPDTTQEFSTAKVVEMYHDGYAGAFHDPEMSDQVDDEIRASGGLVDGEDTAHRYGFAGDGAGQLNLLYPAVVEAYGLRALTKPGQKTGDCVSMAGRDVCLFLICLEALSKAADEVSGRIEGLPKVSDKAAENGVFVNEGIYLHRGHNDQGMSCSQGVHYVTTEGGIIIREKYPEADLESYNVQFELRGRSGSPEWLDKIGRLHPIRDVTRPKGPEACRDFIARGKPLWACSSLGWSDERDEFGYSKTGRGWSHSWHVIGYDDRDVTKKKWGFPLALTGHRWAIWNGGGREIYQSAGLVPEDRRQLWQQLGLIAPSGNLLIPHGYWWQDARLLSKSSFYAVSGASGWETSTLPDFLGGW